MARWAVIDGNNTVVNMVEWDGQTEWAPPAGHTVRELAADESPNPLTAVYDPDKDTFSDDGTPKAPVPELPELSADAKLANVLEVLIDKGVITADDVKNIGEIDVTVDGEIVAP
jgi:hypothetical protein